MQLVFKFSKLLSSFLQPHVHFVFQSGEILFQLTVLLLKWSQLNCELISGLFVVFLPLVFGILCLLQKFNCSDQLFVLGLQNVVLILQGCTLLPDFLNLNIIYSQRVFDIFNVNLLRFHKLLELVDVLIFRSYLELKLALAEPQLGHLSLLVIKFALDQGDLSIHVLLFFQDFFVLGAWRLTWELLHALRERMRLVGLHCNVERLPVWCEIVEALFAHAVHQRLLSEGALGLILAWIDALRLLMGALEGWHHGRPSQLLHMSLELDWYTASVGLVLTLASLHHAALLRGCLHFIYDTRYRVTQFRDHVDFVSVHLLVRQMMWWFLLLMLRWKSGDQLILIVVSRTVALF